MDVRYNMIKVFSAFVDLTNIALSQIEAFTNTSSKFYLGFSAMYTNYVQSDYNSLSVFVEEHLKFYNGYYKNNRNKAATYVSDAIYQLLEFDAEVQHAPEVFNSFYEAQSFYASISILLHKCIISNEMAHKYLLQMLADENGIKQPLSPDSFYVDDDDSSSCKSQYEIAKQTLERLVPVTGFMYKKLSLWLQDNSMQIISSAAEILSQDVTKNTNFSIIIPGFWILMECNDCMLNTIPFNYSKWFNIVAILTTNMSAQITRCLLQYERILVTAAEMTKPKPLDAPKGPIKSILANYQDSLRAKVRAINFAIHSYMTGITGAVKMVTNIGSILPDMTDIIDIIETKIVIGEIRWEADVLNWLKAIASKYKSIMISLAPLQLFMPYNQNFINVIDRLFVWRWIHTEFENYYFKYIQADELKQINDDLYNFLLINSSNIIDPVMQNAAQFNVKYSERFCDLLVAMTNDWRAQLANTTTVINTYNNQLIVEDTFSK